MPEQVQRALGLISAALRYNKLSVKDGFYAFDQDNDRRLSLRDLQTTCEDLQLGLTIGEVNSLFEHLAEDGRSYISFDRWEQAMGTVDGNDVLRSRGIDMDILSNSRAAPKKAQTIEGEDDRSSDNDWDLISAALQLNNLDVRQGFNAFDCDGDGRISVQDLIAACSELELGISHEDVLKMHEQASSDGKYICFPEWDHAVASSDGSNVLKSRGINVDELRSRSAESGTSAFDVDREDTFSQASVSSASSSASDALSTSGSFDARLLATRELRKQAAEKKYASDEQDGISLIGKVMEINKLSLEECFSLFDVDADGIISISDLMQVAHTLEFGLTSDKIKKCFLDLDEDRDGKVNLHDWTTVLTGPKRAFISPDTEIEKLAEPKQIQSDFRDSKDNQADSGTMSTQKDEQLLPADTVTGEQRNIEINDTPAMSMNYVTSRPSSVSTSSGSESVSDSGSISPVAEGDTPRRSIESTDLICLIEKVIELNKLGVDESFALFDVDEDGVISVGDLTSAADTLEFGLPSEKIKKLFMRIDADQDGFISASEWMDALDRKNTGSEDSLIDKADQELVVTPVPLSTETGEGSGQVDNDADKAISKEFQEIADAKVIGSNEPALQVVEEKSLSSKEQVQNEREDVSIQQKADFLSLQMQQISDTSDSEGGSNKQEHYQSDFEISNEIQAEDFQNAPEVVLLQPIVKMIPSVPDTRGEGKSVSEDAKGDEVEVSGRTALNDGSEADDQEFEKRQDHVSAATASGKDEFRVGQDIPMQTDVLDSSKALDRNLDITIFGCTENKKELQNLNVEANDGFECGAEKPISDAHFEDVQVNPETPQPEGLLSVPENGMRSDQAGLMTKHSAIGATSSTADDEERVSDRSSEEVIASISEAHASKTPQEAVRQDSPDVGDTRRLPSEASSNALDAAVNAEKGTARSVLVPQTTSEEDTSPNLPIIQPVEGIVLKQEDLEANQSSQFDTNVKALSDDLPNHQSIKAEGVSEGNSHPMQMGNPKMIGTSNYPVSAVDSEAFTATTFEDHNNCNGPDGVIFPKASLPANDLLHEEQIVDPEACAAITSGDSNVSNDPTTLDSLTARKDLIAANDVEHDEQMEIPRAPVDALTASNDQDPSAAVQQPTAKLESEENQDRVSGSQSGVMMVSSEAPDETEHLFPVIALPSPKEATLSGIEGAEGDSDVNEAPDPTAFSGDSYQQPLNADDSSIVQTRVPSSAVPRPSDAELPIVEREPTTPSKKEESDENRVTNMTDAQDQKFFIETKPTVPEIDTRKDQGVSHVLQGVEISSSTVSSVQQSAVTIEQVSSYQAPDLLPVDEKKNSFDGAASVTDEQHVEEMCKKVEPKSQSCDVPLVPNLNEVVNAEAVDEDYAEDFEVPNTEDEVTTLAQEILAASGSVSCHETESKDDGIAQIDAANDDNPMPDQALSAPQKEGIDGMLDAITQNADAAALTITQDPSSPFTKHEVDSTYQPLPGNNVVVKSTKLMSVDKASPDLQSDITSGHQVSLNDSSNPITGLQFAPKTQYGSPSIFAGSQQQKRFLNIRPRMAKEADALTSDNAQSQTKQPTFETESHAQTTSTGRKPMVNFKKPSKFSNAGIVSSSSADSLQSDTQHQAKEPMEIKGLESGSDELELSSNNLRPDIVPAAREGSHPSEKLAIEEPEMNHQTSNEEKTLALNVSAATAVHSSLGPAETDFRGIDMEGAIRESRPQSEDVDESMVQSSTADPGKGISSSIGIGKESTNNQEEEDSAEEDVAEVKDSAAEQYESDFDLADGEETHSSPLNSQVDLDGHTGPQSVSFPIVASLSPLCFAGAPNEGSVANHNQSSELAFPETATYEKIGDASAKSCPELDAERQDVTAPPRSGDDVTVSQSDSDTAGQNLTENLQHKQDLAAEPLHLDPLPSPSTTLDGAALAGHRDDHSRIDDKIQDIRTSHVSFGKQPSLARDHVKQIDHRLTEASANHVTFEKQLGLLEEGWMSSPSRRTVYRYALEQMAMSIVHDIVDSVVKRQRNHEMTHKALKAKIEADRNRGYRKLRPMEMRLAEVRMVTNEETFRRCCLARDKELKMNAHAVHLRKNEAKFTPHFEAGEMDAIHLQERRIQRQRISDDKIQRVREAVEEVAKLRESEYERRKNLLDFLEQGNSQETQSLHDAMREQIARDAYVQYQQEAASAYMKRLTSEEERVKLLHRQAAQEKWIKIKFEEQKFMKMKHDIIARVHNRKAQRAVKRNQLQEMYEEALASVEKGAEYGRSTKRRVQDPNSSLRAAISCYFSGPDSSELKDIKFSLKQKFLLDMTPLAGLSAKQIEEKFRRTFLWMDADGSGHIDAHEMSKAMEKIGIKITEKELSALIAELDKDSNGTISQNEFVAFGLSLLNENHEVSGSPTQHSIIKQEIKAPEFDKGLKARAIKARLDEEEATRRRACELRSAWEERRHFVQEAIRAFEEKALENEYSMSLEKQKSSDSIDAKMFERIEAVRSKREALEEYGRKELHKIRAQHSQEKDEEDEFTRRRNFKLKPLLQRGPFSPSSSSFEKSPSAKKSNDGSAGSSRLSSPGFPTLKSDRPYLEDMSRTMQSYLGRTPSPETVRKDYRRSPGSSH